MRKVLLLGVLVAAAPHGCAGHRAVQGGAAPALPAVAEAPVAVAPVAAANPAVVATTAPDPFRAEVAPVLARRCEPCHNPGGIMYGRMPFDDPATVAAHPEGIRKRLIDPAERALVERWIASRPKS